MKELSERINRESQWTVFQRRYTDVQQACEKMFNIISYKRNANHFTVICYKDYYQKSKNELILESTWRKANPNTLLMSL